MVHGRNLELTNLMKMNLTAQSVSALSLHHDESLSDMWHDLGYFDLNEDQ